MLGAPQGAPVFQNQARASRGLGLREAQVFQKQKIKKARRKGALENW